MDWVPRQVQCGNIKMSILEVVQDHPLKPMTTNSVDGHIGVKRGTFRNNNTSSSTRTPTPVQTPAQLGNDFTDPLPSHASLDGSDPLSQFAHEEMDPLTKMATDEWDYAENITVVSKKANGQKKDLVEPWANRRTGILNKYTTSGILVMTTGRLGPNTRPIRNLPEKVKNCMEQLDDIEEDASKRVSEYLSQQNYIARLEQLNNDLVQAWNSDQRVKALKIAIQAAKLLSDTSAMKFYPSKFVLVTDILDNFGQLVYNRLKMKSECPKPGSKIVKSLPENFTPDMIPENARETCQNWFYKIASIRELVPRLYVELAIIKSYRFLKNSDIRATLLRITRMIRGIGDPLVAIYARCYLCRMGLVVSQLDDLSFVKENLYDFLTLYPRLFSADIKKEVRTQELLHYQYTNLYIPALEWIIQIIAATSTEKELDDIFSRCQKVEYDHEPLLNIILKSFNPSYIARHEGDILQWIKRSNKEVYPTYELYCSLGECLIKEKCYFGGNNSAAYSHVENYLWNLNNPEIIMQIVEVWINFVIMYCSFRGYFNTITIIIKKMTPATDYRMHEQFHTQLQTIVEKIVANLDDIQSWIAKGQVLPLIDLFIKDCIKTEVCKTIVEGLSAQTGPIENPIVIDTTMSLMKIMHQSVSTFTVEDEKRQISILICSLIQRIDYKQDFEKQLNFYVEARATFPNLESVHMQLIQCVNRLAIDTRKIVQGHHTRKTASFVRACVAFCFITIPSLTLVRTRLQLYLLSGQVALSNQCLEQADACFKAALSLVPEMPKTIEIDGRQKSSEPYLLAYLSSFLSTLLVVPDSPEHGVLYLMRGLLNAAQRWFDENSFLKWEFYLRVLDLLSTVIQENYPYHVDKIDSNDTLYGSDPKFISEVNKISTKIFLEILNQIKNYGIDEQREKQCHLAFSLFIRMIVRADISQTPLARLVVNLWLKVRKFNFIDKKFSDDTFAYLISENRPPEVLKYVSEYVLQ